MDNAGEYTSKAFDDYCMTLGIKVEHPVPYIHTQNGLAESLIKCIKLIARLLLQHSDLPIDECETHLWFESISHTIFEYFISKFM